MSELHMLSATEFKAKCVEVLDRVGRHEWERVVVTKRGIPVAVVVAPPAPATAIEQLHGFMRGQSSFLRASI